MSIEAEKLVEMVSHPLEFYSSQQLRVRGFDRNYRGRLERDEFKLARISPKGDLSYLGGYLLAQAQKEKLGIKTILRKKPKSYSQLCPFAFCQAMEIHPDELPETINIDGKSQGLIERTQIKNNIQYRINIRSLAYLSLPVIEDIPIAEMTNEELARRNRVSGQEKFTQEFLRRYEKIIKVMLNKSPSFAIALEQMGYSVLEVPAKNGASDGFSRFDLTRGILVETYIPLKVKGAVLDYLRDLDEVPRLVRKAEKIMKPYFEEARKDGKEFDLEAFIKKSGIPRETATLAHELFIGSHGHKVSMDTNSPNRWSSNHQQDKEVTLKDTYSPEPTLSRNPIKLYDTREGISRLLECLDPIEREMIVAYFLADDSMKDVGETLDLSESRVSQMIHGNNKIGGILYRLRNRAARIFPEFVPRELRSSFPDTG